MSKRKIIDAIIATCAEHGTAMQSMADPMILSLLFSLASDDKAAVTQPKPISTDKKEDAERPPAES
ncbi:MAG: hypothetical protein PHW03_04350 [Eubacteriales bacterium]|nr:hypothetical protein [Eubacteriales bacterium]MDD4390012.1 hypothetical protein [Eubacteriales bacterium]